MTLEKHKKNTLQSAIALLVALLISVIFICFITVPSSKMEDFALGGETVSILSKTENGPNHSYDLSDVRELFAFWEKRGARPYVLWLGNSQLHGVNQYRQGQACAPQLLYEELNLMKKDLIAISPPNSSISEYFFCYTALKAIRSPAAVVISACFDKTRNDGVRDKIAIAFNDEKNKKILMESNFGTTMVTKYLSAATVVNEDLKGVHQTPQEKSERFLNDFLDSHVPVWEKRAPLRGMFFIELYKLRNFVFHISPQTKRKMIKPCYDENLKALETILKDGQDNGIPVFVYIQPLRNDVTVPYDKDEYKKFKEDVEQLAAKYNGFFRNFENEVPSELWGKKDTTTLGGGMEGELDFMHFQYGGHQILSRKVGTAIKIILNEKK